MKIIEAMKQIKELQEKAEDLRQKAAKYSADYETETPVYGTKEDQRAQVEGWVQAHHDLLKHILFLRVGIQRTNLATQVTIRLANDETVTQSIAEWIHRRRDLAKAENEMWSGLGRKESQMRETVTVTSTGDRTEQKIRRYYSPQVRDLKRELYITEPNRIDSTLEIANATTELIEA